jgi:hypothetical protein
MLFSSSTSGKENVVEEDDNHIEECVKLMITIQLRTKMKILTN